jgi:hypothetical protein
MQSEINKLLQKYTGHKDIRLCQRGNAAIFAAFVIAKKAGIKTILIPDQGGWMSYRTYPELLGLHLKVLKTDLGLINPEAIEPNSALIMTTLAGYAAEQDVEEIYEECKKKKTILILDITGTIGHKHDSDIALGSFGHWKVVDVGFGGFISCRTDLFRLGNEIFSTFAFCEEKYPLLLEKLKKAPDRLEGFFKIQEKIKKELKNFTIIHPERKGINVIIQFSNETERKEIVNYCEKNSYEFVICPKEHRVLIDAISIEVKRK